MENKSVILVIYSMLSILSLLGCKNENPAEIHFETQSQTNRTVVQAVPNDSIKFSNIVNPWFFRATPSGNLFIYDGGSNEIISLKRHLETNRLQVYKTMTISMGHGPGESIQITDMYISDSLVALADPRISRILIWPLFSDSIKTYKIPMRPYRILSVRDRNILYCPESYPLQKISSYDIVTGDTSSVISDIPLEQHKNNNIYHGSKFAELDEINILQAYTRLGRMVVYKNFIPFIGVYTINGNLEPTIYNKEYAENIQITYVDHNAIISCSDLTSSNNQIAILSHNPSRKHEHVDFYSSDNLSYLYSIRLNGRGHKVALINDSLLYVLWQNWIYTYRLSDEWSNL
ncbi:MAG: 6-bladed beta-propeller [Candidatus Marinimicrobia bacterium]|nr:6-bladed beta-propeller [Candidatus Neomarinimicrobiota bacterium]MCF7829455.1 6-bladed beta-propeller [Candidatus Neomarinimicrobiota bacterium]MCF7882334.1 6-bladed beta-propeller [Candidatus Neomarinimicrobiota bacterium]